MGWIKRIAGRKLVGCTVVTRTFLAHARVLARSFLDNGCGDRFFVFVVDGLPDGLSEDRGLKFVDVRDLRISHLRSLCFSYTALELCCALKAFAVAWLLEVSDGAPVSYLDSDVLIFRRMRELLDETRDSTIVLTPHLLEPLPDDGRTPSEVDIILSGVYNMGFFMVRPGSAARDFLTWLGARDRRECVLDMPAGLFLDQKWAELVPGMFPGVQIFRDETYNVAYWNLPGRRLEQRQGTFFVNGRPLSFFHFSGADLLRKQFRPTHQDRLTVADGTALSGMFDRYIDLLDREGHAVSRLSDYGYSSFEDGAPIAGLLRKIYRELGDQERERFGDPFRSDRRDSFFAWATSPCDDLHGLSPFLQATYHSRPELLLKFPDVHGRDRQAFLEWCLGEGQREVGYDAGQLRVAEALSAARRTRLT